jgi:hypothetical protein
VAEIYRARFQETDLVATSYCKNEHLFPLSLLLFRALVDGNLSLSLAIVEHVVSSVPVWGTPPIVATRRPERIVIIAGVKIPLPGRFPG